MHVTLSHCNFLKKKSCRNLFLSKMESHEGVGSAAGSLCDFLEKKSCENIFSKNGKLKER